MTSKAELPRAPAPGDGADAPRSPHAHEGGPRVEFVNFAAGADPRRLTRGVSQAEVVQLVSRALDSALRALEDERPETFLQLHACEARAGMRKALASLPGEWAADPSVLADYREAIVFQKLTLELALAIVNAIERYAQHAGGERTAAAS